ncbi:methionine aminopeptidase [Aquibacillus saliphilus]|uniref:methionine aminopeptidase n=1 Tax=Aquibacillus saliphilus TaxID=1909422 RepID=UPI001CF0B623|nr:methionine aminopeptidase [Aquibacillus saliphilus]
MGLFSVLSDWTNKKYQKKVSKMEQLGKCPDCNGMGIPIMSYEHYYGTNYHCPGCNGSGLFEDWMK